jgi:hypothetical protein
MVERILPPVNACEQAALRFSNAVDDACWLRAPTGVG